MINGSIVRYIKRIATLAAFSGGLALSIPLAAIAVEVTVTVENLAPRKGLIMTPLWVGFHDGSFDIYDIEESASPALERIAEAGNPAPLTEVFQQSVGVSMSGALMGPGTGPDSPPVIPPGATVSSTFTLDENDSRSHYFSYASMIVPSNDAFVANSFSADHRIFNRTGDFVGADFMIYGFAIKDAGTEINTEIPSETAALGQMQPDAGDPENGVIRQHAGFTAGNILRRFPNADFKAPGAYPIARIRVELASDARRNDQQERSPQMPSNPSSSGSIISPNDSMPSNQVNPGQ